MGELAQAQISDGDAMCRWPEAMPAMQSIQASRCWLLEGSGCIGSAPPLPPGACGSASGGMHIFWPSHCWPHQQRPSVSMMQVPLPQQRGSSVMSGFLQT